MIIIMESRNYRIQWEICSECNVKTASDLAENGAWMSMASLMIYMSGEERNNCTFFSVGKYVQGPIFNQLVVSTPLKNISQIGSSSQLLGKIQNVPVTTNQLIYH